MSYPIVKHDQAQANPRVVRAVFLVHGLITLAGAIVLTAFPRLIPAAVGITLQPSDYLLVYLVAAAELTQRGRLDVVHVRQRRGGVGRHLLEAALVCAG